MCSNCDDTAYRETIEVDARARRRAEGAGRYDASGLVAPHQRRATELRQELRQELQQEPVADACAVCGESLCEHGLCTDTGSPWRDGCPGSYAQDGYQCQNCAEARQEQRIAEYYGGDTPQTDRERQEVERTRRR